MPSSPGIVTSSTTRSGRPSAATRAPRSRRLRGRPRSPPPPDIRARHREYAPRHRRRRCAASSLCSQLETLDRRPHLDAASRKLHGRSPKPFTAQRLTHVEEIHRARTQTRDRANERRYDMNRKTAIAAALAITMSLTSGVVALGANAGALGFGGAKPNVATQNVLPAGARLVGSSASKPARHRGESEDPRSAPPNRRRPRRKRER